MNTKRIVSLVLLLMLIAVAGCATTGAKLSPQQEFLLNAEKAYLVQYNDYMAMSQLTTLTAEQKDVLRNKKAVLVQVEPILKIYRTTVMAGGTPDPVMEQAIFNLLNSIGGKF